MGVPEESPTRPTVSNGGLTCTSNPPLLTVESPPIHTSKAPQADMTSSMFLSFSRASSDKGARS